MRRWYEPRKDRPDLTPEDVAKRGFGGFMSMLWREFWDLLKLNLLFLVSCIPVVTIPAAITAMNRITSLMAQDKNHFLWRDYWKAFKRDFLKSLLGGAIYFAALAIFTISTIFYYRLMGWSKITVLFAGFSACILILVYMSSLYFFPMLATVELPMKALLRNAVVLTFANIKRSLLALLWALLLLGAGVGLLPFSAIFVIFIMFSFVNLITNFVVWPVIDAQVISPDSRPAKSPEIVPEAPKEEQTLHSAGVDELNFDEEDS